MIARDHVVVANADDAPARHPAGALAAVLPGIRLGVSAEVDRDLHLGVSDLPRGAHREPRVGNLHLALILEGLLEDAVFVADPVADARDPERGHRVDEAGGQTTEATVAQPGLDLLLTQVLDVDATGRHCLAGDLGELGRREGVVELAAQQVFGREVADHLLRRAVAALAGRLEPACHEVGAHRARQREVLVGQRGRRQGHALAEVQLVEELAHEAVHGVRRRDHRTLGEGVGRLRSRSGLVPVFNACSLGERVVGHVRLVRVLRDGQGVHCGVGGSNGCGVIHETTG